MKEKNMKTIKYNNFIFFEKKTVGSKRKVVKVFGVKYRSYAGDTEKESTITILEML